MDRFMKAVIPDHEVERLTRETAEDFRRRPGFYVALGLNSAQAVARFTRAHANDGETWKNDTYTVALFRDIAQHEGWPTLVHLSIKRNDRAPIHDWRDLQEIKNELVGPECEGVELYPAESRRVDSANQYHLFVISVPGHRWPFGFTDRLVDGDTGATRAKQRPFEEA